MLLETEFRRKRDHKIKRFEKEPRRRREGLNRRILLGEMEKKWSESEKYRRCRGGGGGEYFICMNGEGFEKRKMLII